jgi:hypothetical protein
MGKYDDIIGLPHHVSATRPRMSPMDRAAQFSPFAALTGYEAVISETGRLTGSRVELSEDKQAELDAVQRLITERLAQCPLITVTYFVEDDRKSGGEYMTLTGNACRLDPYQRLLVLTDGTRIPLDDTLQLNI